MRTETALERPPWAQSGPPTFGFRDAIIRAPSAMRDSLSAVPIAGRINASCAIRGIIACRSGLCSFSIRIVACPMSRSALDRNFRPIVGVTRNSERSNNSTLAFQSTKGTPIRMTAGSRTGGGPKLASAPGPKFDSIASRSSRADQGPRLPRPRTSPSAAPAAIHPPMAASESRYRGRRGGSCSSGRGTGRGTKRISAPSLHSTAEPR